MSQSAQKGKPKRQRANSLNQTPQKYYDNEYTGGGGNNGRKNKSHYQTSGAFSTTKIYTNSSRSAELQTLLNTLPTGAPYSQSHTNKRRGGGYGGENHMSSQNPRKAGGGPHNVSNADDDAVVDDEESNRLNATALRRIDPAFSKLFGTASQVAVYRYNPSTQSWDKTDTVGCLFLYERNAPPKYGLVVMNRKNANNFIQCFGPDGQVVLHTPYLLLRAVEDVNSGGISGDGAQAIHCIWFYEAQDCSTTANILRKLGLTFEEEQVSSGGKVMSSHDGAIPSGSGNALFQILQQGSKSTPQMKKAVPRVITAEELESQMLNESETMHAGQNRHSATPVSNGCMPAQLNRSSASPAVAYIPRKTPPPGRGDKSVLHQFLNMSITDKQKGSKNGATAMPPVSHKAVAHSLGPQNQMRTVEQLEREMKKDRASEDPNAPATIQSELLQTLGFSNMTGTDKTDYSQSSSQNRSKSAEQAILDNIVGKSLNETDPDVIREVLQNVEPSNLILVTETVPGGNETRLTWRLNRSSSLRKETDSTFTTPTGEFLSASGTRCSSQLGLGAEGRYFDGPLTPLRPAEVKPTPLTKDQLLQAMNYLLQHDPDFVGKIHDAYVKSLQQAYEGRQF